MSRINPAILRQSGNVLNNRFTGTSDYYYVKQLKAQLSIIERTKSLNLVYPVSSQFRRSKPVIIQPSVMPLVTILRAQRFNDLLLTNSYD